MRWEGNVLTVCSVLDPLGSIHCAAVVQSFGALARSSG